MLKQFDIEAHADPKAVGIWTNDSGTDAKVCAIGVRIKRGVSLHGLALNVETDPRYFDLIVPCGLAGRSVTSMRKLLGDLAPGIEHVKETLAREVAEWLTRTAQPRTTPVPSHDRS
jgi:lipoate-protein ligase B